MRSIRAAVLGGGVLSLASFASAAPLPYTVIETGAQSATGPNLTSDQYGSLQSPFAGGMAQATASADGSGLPSSVFAQTGRNGNASFVDEIAYAHERYWFEVQGADGTVQVDLAGQGRVSVFGPYAMGGGVGSAITVGSSDGSLVVSRCTGGYQLQPCQHSGNTLDPFSFNGSFALQANTAYYVDLWTYTWLPVGSGGSTSDIAWANASMALPTFANSFGNAGAYNFSYSSPVPEPEEWALTAAGLALLGFVGVRRRSRAGLRRA